MKKRRASSTDVAALAGVSQSAVSRTFTPGASVSDRTRAKVLAAAGRLNYRPNALARSLITRRSRMIALVIGDIGNPFYAKIVNVVSGRLQARGFHVLVFAVGSDDRVEAALEEMLSYQVDGVLLVSAALSNEMAKGCARMGTPVVLYNRYAKGVAVSSVRVENGAGGRRVADFLVDGGHSRLAFVGGTRVDATSLDRQSGFVARLGERGGRLWKRVESDYTFEGGQQAARELLGHRTRPDAIFCASDLMALGVMDTARLDFGLRVPDDLSIVGFDDIPSAAWPSYRLTTVRQPVERLADEALGLLLAKVDDPTLGPTTRLIPGELVVRASARLPR